MATDPMAVAWAAALCVGVLLWTVVDDGRRRRARRTLGADWHDGRGRTRTAGGSGGASGNRLREIAEGLRCRVARYAAEVGDGPRWWHRWARVEVLCLPVGAVLAGATRSVLPLLAGMAAVPLVGRALRRRAERVAAERGAEAVGALCGALAGDLRAGRPPHAALGDTIEAAGWTAVPELSGAARLLLSAARFGGDVPQALRAAARLSEGTRGLAAMAACWQVALDGGAGLAAALDRLAAALRAESDQRDDLRAQLAGPRSTAGLLALLPLFGVVLGAGLGADPARVLLHTATGLVCLLVGGLLEWAGLAWTARIIRAAESGRAGGPGAGPARAPDGPRGPARREVAGLRGGMERADRGPRAVAVVAVAGAGVGSVHSLGTVAVALAAAGGALAVAGGAGQRRRQVRRLRAALGEVRPRRAGPDRLRHAVGGPVRRWGPAAAAGLVAGALVGGALGVLVGLLGAAGVLRVLRGRPKAAGGRTAASEPDVAQLPLCADLMAACLAAGASPGEAAGAVGGCLGGTLGAALIRAQAELRLGGDPAQCWQRFGGVPAAREMGRCLARASTTGVAPVAEMSRLAADLRAAHGRTALAGARRAAVLATAPLGLCFLPAFLLVGVVPVVIGLAGTVLGAGSG
ncbi:type II secretion system F family protein [Actinacidiphila paucisporea]|uniref:Flp pilus assembly protein TadB n=1 Tax=Actinacidiphila paucisporea TaxID=310782 RepID=A0A1M7QKU3_9ACTN|nr:type II secretion system F family protein [Actinacidiphila paucisporea]SHN31503.1 Flp pilus assembly protein TadB [Actinacidiphila paucisporea]